jgi:hypothetical protein
MSISYLPTYRCDINFHKHNSNSGYIFCSDCGFQSQDFVAEAADDDDNMQLYGAGSRNLRSEWMRKVLRDVGEKRQRVAKIITDEEDISRLDPLKMLDIYQYSLRSLFNTVLGILRVEDSNQMEFYRRNLRELWFAYLDQWSSGSNCTDCRVENSFIRSKHHSCTIAVHMKYHPLLLTKTALLGFMYLALRVSRSAVLPCDMVRWCEEGILPYANLWDSMLMRYASETHGTDYSRHLRWFYRTPDGGPRRFITADGILFLTSAVAQAINRSIPCLNTPLVALHMINQLGLPGSVWQHYVRICQLHHSEHVPLRGLEALDQQHAEHVMAAVICAVKLCPDWTMWSLHWNRCGSRSKDSSSGHTSAAAVAIPAGPTPIPMPESVDEARCLPREMLQQYLQQVKSISPSLDINSAAVDTTTFSDKIKHKYPFNIAIARSIGSVGTTGSSYSQEEGLSCDYKETSCCLPSVAVHGESLALEDLCAATRRAMKDLHGTMKRRIGAVESVTNQDYRLYISYVRHEEDVTSSHHVQYLILLERCAKYLRCYPQVMHDLVTNIDRQIMLLIASRGSMDNCSDGSKKKLSSSSSSTSSDYRHSKLSNAEKGAFKYRRSSASTLPTLRQLGLTHSLEVIDSSSSSDEGGERRVVDYDEAAVIKDECDAHGNFEDVDELFKRSNSNSNDPIPSTATSTAAAIPLHALLSNMTSEQLYDDSWYQKQRAMEEEFVASHRYMQGMAVDCIIKHRGNTRRRRSLEFFVRWVGLPDAQNTWEPWGKLYRYHIAALYSYLRSHSLVALTTKSKMLAVQKRESVEAEQQHSS